MFSFHSSKTIGYNRGPVRVVVIIIIIIINYKLTELSPTTNQTL